MINIWQIIINKCIIESQLQILLTCRILVDRIYILYLNELFLNDKILNQHKFRFVIKLNACHNPSITNVKHMHNLVELDAEGNNCGICQDGISGLNLIKLNVSNNPKITNVKFMHNLIELDAYHNCGID